MGLPFVQYRQRAACIDRLPRRPRRHCGVTMIGGHFIQNSENECPTGQQCLWRLGNNLVNSEEFSDLAILTILIRAPARVPLRLETRTRSMANLRLLRTDDVARLDRAQSNRE